MLVAGINGGAMSLPLRFPAHDASFGRNRGAAARATTRTITAAPTRRGSPSSLALVTITIAVPVTRLTDCMMIDEPAAARPDNPLSLAITPIAVSDQMLPG